MRINTASTPDPDRVRARRRCLSVAGHCCPGSWCLHRRRRHQHRPSVFCSTASDQQCATCSSSARLAYTGLSTSDHQVEPVQLGSCGYFWVSADPTAVSAQCRHSARLFTPDVRTHYSTASRTTLVTHLGAHLVPVVCSGISLCEWHSTSVFGRQPAADIRGRRSSSSSFCRQPDAAGAVNSSSNSRRPRVFCGCSAGMKQAASTDQDRLLFNNIPARDQDLPFLSVI